MCQNANNVICVLSNPFPGFPPQTDYVEEKRYDRGDRKCSLKWLPIQ